MRYLFIIFSGSLLITQDLLPLIKKPNTKRTQLKKNTKKNKKGERKIYDLSNRGDRETITEKAIEKATLSIDPVEILNEGITIIMNGPYEGAIKADQTDETDNQYIVIGDYKLPLPIGSNEREAYYILRHMTDLLLLKINDAMAETFSLSLETVVLNREEQQALSTIINENKEKIDHLSKNTAVPSLLHNIPFINTVILLTMRALLKGQKIKIKENWWDTIKSFFGKNNTITMFGDLFDFIKEYPLYQELDHLRNNSNRDIVIYLMANLALTIIKQPTVNFGFSPRFYADMILAASLSNDKPLSEDKTHQHNQQINTTTISMLKELLKRYANIFNRRLPSLKRFNSNTALFALESNILKTILLVTGGVLAASLLTRGNLSESSKTENLPAIGTDKDNESNQVSPKESQNPANKESQNPANSTVKDTTNNTTQISQPPEGNKEEKQLEEELNKRFVFGTAGILATGTVATLLATKGKGGINNQIIQNAMNAIKKTGIKTKENIKEYKETVKKYAQDTREKTKETATQYKERVKKFAEDMSNKNPFGKKAKEFKEAQAVKEAEEKLAQLAQEARKVKETQDKLLQEAKEAKDQLTESVNRLVENNHMKAAQEAKKAKEAEEKLAQEARKVKETQDKLLQEAKEAKDQLTESVNRLVENNHMKAAQEAKKAKEAEEKLAQEARKVKETQDKLLQEAKEAKDQLTESVNQLVENNHMKAAQEAKKAKEAEEKLAQEAQAVKEAEEKLDKSVDKLVKKNKKKNNKKAGK